MALISPLYKNWFEYDLYANNKVMAILDANMGHLPDDSLKLFSHIIAAHDIWNTRITGTQQRFKVWERIPVTEMPACLTNNFNCTLAIIESMEETGIVEYVNTMGNRFSNNIPDILFHLLTHSHYHRGQIARNLRENGIEPAETNFIVFKR